MEKIMKHKDEEIDEIGERITVAEVMKSANDYYSLSDFVKVCFLIVFNVIDMMLCV